MQTFKSDELHKRVDEVLFYIWDPIGVSPNPDARGEYSSYVQKILEMLKDGRDAEVIGKYLGEIQSGMMSLPVNEEKVKEVAIFLLSYKEAIEDGRT